MVARLLDWSYNISCLIIGLSRGPMQELGGITSLRARLGQFASMELEELRELGPTTTILAVWFPIKHIPCGIIVRCQLESLDCRITFSLPSSLEVSILRSFKASCN